MTPFEAEILRYIEQRAKPVSIDALCGQYGITTGYCDLIFKSLKRQLLVEQDRKHYRVTAAAQNALTQFDDQYKYIPFEGKEKW